MRKVIILSMLLLFWTDAMAQGNLEMAVVIPNNPEEISRNTYSILGNKLLGAMTRNGVASVEYSGIVVMPEVSFLDKQVVESGMRKTIIADVDITFNAIHVVTGEVFNSVTISLRGFGESLDDVTKVAVNSLTQDDDRIRNFINQSKLNIIDYYKRNTTTLISKARNLASMQRFEEALALLETYPASLNGYKEVSQTMVKIYKEYQNDVCGQILQQARSDFAAGDYGSAVVLLQQVDMQSACASEAKLLCQKIKQSRDAEAAREAAAYEREMQRASSIENNRIKAIRDVAVAYYKSRPKYYYIF